MRKIGDGSDVQGTSDVRKTSNPSTDAQTAQPATQQQELSPSSVLPDEKKAERKHQKELSGVMAQAAFQHSLETKSHPLGGPLTQVGREMAPAPTPFQSWDSHHYGRDAFSFLLFPGFHSASGRESTEFKATVDAISKGGDDYGRNTTGATTILRTYSEFANWALQNGGLPNNPPIQDLEKCLGTAVDLDGAKPSKIKETIAKELGPGRPPVLMPLDIPGHQTYVSFEQHPKEQDKVIMRYFDRQRPDLEIECRMGPKQVSGYLGPGPEFKRNRNTELCFEFKKSEVTDGKVVDTLLESVKGFDGISPARANMTAKLGAMAEDVYAAPDSRPQVAQAGHAINCTWASFESFLSHIHGNQFKYEVARMREFIVENHIVKTGGGFNEQALPAVKFGIEKALNTAQGEEREALLRAQQKLKEMGK